MKHYLIGARITPLAVAWWCTCGDEINVVSELRWRWRMLTRDKIGVTSCHRLSSVVTTR